MNYRAVLLAFCATLLLAGCAAPIIGPLTLSHLSTIASATTMTVEGKGAAEVALDLATGKDCRMMEGAMRKDRAICEKQGSPATEEDFKGVIALLTNKPPKAKNANDTMLAEAPAPRAVRAYKRVRPETLAELKTAGAVITTLEADQAAKAKALTDIIAGPANSTIADVKPPVVAQLPELLPLPPRAKPRAPSQDIPPIASR